MCRVQRILFTFLIIYFKSVETQICNQLGTHCTIRQTDHRLADGTCSCHPNVTGPHCDTCAPGYYGLWTGTGCSPCGRHCNSEGTLAASNSLPQCDTLGRCLCKSGYYGARCEEKVSSISTTCEECKPNCYKQKKTCTMCGPCYGLVHEKFYEYMHLKNIEPNEDVQKRYADLENKINDLLSKITVSLNYKEIEDKIKKYYQQLSSTKKQLGGLTNYQDLLKELEEKLELFDKKVTHINEMKKGFRKQLQNLTTCAENTNLAKILNNITLETDRIVQHSEDIKKIALYANETCTDTCKLYDEIDKSLGHDEQLLNDLQKKLMDWKNLKRNSSGILREFNDLCNKLEDIQIPEVEKKQSEMYIKDLNEKLQLYQLVDKLLGAFQDINVDEISKAQKNIERTVKEIDKFVDGKEKDLMDLSSMLKVLQKAEFDFKEVENRIDRLRTVIRQYFEKNKEIIESLRLFLVEADENDKLTEIEREIEFLTQESEYILEMARKLQDRLNHTKHNLDEKFVNFTTIIRKDEISWKQYETIYLNVINIYDFVLKEIANEKSIDDIVDEINEAYELLKVTNEKNIIDIDLEYLKNAKAELMKLTVSAQEICGAQTGDSDTSTFNTN